MTGPSLDVLLRDPVTGSATRRFLLELADATDDEQFKDLYTEMAQRHLPGKGTTQ